MKRRAKNTDEAPGAGTPRLQRKVLFTLDGVLESSLSCASPGTFVEMRWAREARGSDSDHVVRGFVWRFSGARLPLAGSFRAVVVAVLPSVTGQMGVFEASASSGLHRSNQHFVTPVTVAPGAPAVKGNLAEWRLVNRRTSVGTP